MVLFYMLLVLFIVLIICKIPLRRVFGPISTQFPCQMANSIQKRVFVLISLKFHPNHSDRAFSHSFSQIPRQKPTSGPISTDLTYFLTQFPRSPSSHTFPTKVLAALFFPRARTYVRYYE